MRYKLICCDVFTREVCLAIAQSRNIVDPEFTPKGAHENPKNLQRLLQQKIDQAEKEGIYDAILLGFGLCGNSTAGLKSGTVPLVIPRAHDCCTIFLGSKHKFLEYFKDNLSAEWSSTGYMERGESYLRGTDTGRLLGIDNTYQDLVEKYGEENALFIWETLHPKKETNEIIYIEIPETAGLGYYENIKKMAKKEGKSVKLINGDMKILRGLLEGNWNEEDYLVVPPGKSIKPLYDWETIMTI